MTMAKKPTVGEQVKSGFRRAGGWLLGGAWFGLVLAGITEAFDSEQSFNEGHHPHRVLGYLLLIATAVIFVITANRWKRYLPGIMVFATLGSLRVLENGRNPGDGSIVPRSTGLVYFLVIAGVTAISFSFKKRSPNLLDRMALLVFVASILWTGVAKSFATIAPVVGALCVLAAWAIDRVRHRVEPAGFSRGS
jgi:hypothetical protein